MTTTFLTVSDAALFIEHIVIGVMIGRKADEGGLLAPNNKKTTNQLPPYFWTVFMTLQTIVGFVFEHKPYLVSPTTYNAVSPIVAIINVGTVGRLFYVDYQSIDTTYKAAAKICMSALFVSAIIMKALDMDGLPKDDIDSHLDHFNKVGFHVQHHYLHWTILLGFVAVHMFPHTTSSSSPKGKVSKD